MAHHWRLKGCLRCGGDVLVGPAEETCLQCGQEGDAPVRVVAVAARDNSRLSVRHRRRDGLHMKGENKVDRDAEIRRLCSAGEFQRDVATKFGIHESLVSKILKGVR